MIIFYKLSNLSKITNSNITSVSEIFILDRQNIICNQKNLFYLQFEKSIVVYKNVHESIIDNVYWNVLDPSVKISEHIKKIKSPYDKHSYYNLVKINNSEYFVKKININDCIDKNLFDLDNNPGIIIDPIDRFYI